MGAAEARLFAAEGAMVAIGDVLEEEGRRVVAQIGEAGGKAIFLALDVTSESQWQDAIAATVAEEGFDLLKAPIRRVMRLDAPVPFSPTTRP